MENGQCKVKGQNLTILLTNEEQDGMGSLGHVIFAEAESSSLSYSLLRGYPLSHLVATPLITRALYFMLQKSLTQ